MPDTQSADLDYFFSREQAENAFRDALNKFIGRGKRHKAVVVCEATGVPDRILECFRSYPHGHPDHRPLDTGQKYSLLSYLGADFTSEWLRHARQAAYNLPDGEPDPGELAADTSEHTAKVVRMAADRDFSNDSPDELKATGSRLIDAGMKLVATGTRAGR